MLLRCGACLVVVSSLFLSYFKGKKRDLARYVCTCPETWKRLCKCEFSQNHHSASIHVAVASHVAEQNWHWNSWNRAPARPFSVPPSGLNHIYLLLAQADIFKHLVMCGAFTGTFLCSFTVFNLGRVFFPPHLNRERSADTSPLIFFLWYCSATICFI